MAKPGKILLELCRCASAGYKCGDCWMRNDELKCCGRQRDGEFLADLSNSRTLFIICSGAGA